MIEGIEVLTVSPVTETNLLILLIGAAIVVAIHILILHADGELSFATLLSLPIVFLATFLAIEIFPLPTQETQYKVIIDDSVSFNEFNSNYEIISCEDGKIYTIKEKDKE